MPATRTARRGDTVAYRNADGKFRNGTVIADTKIVGTPGSTKNGSGGTLAAATYTYRVAFVTQGVTTAASAQTSQTTTGSTSTVTIDVTGIVPSGATQWKVYGRSGTEQLMGTVSLPTLTFVDDGSVTPSGALPTDTGNVSILLSSEANKTNIAKTTTYKATNVYFNR